MSQRLLDLVLAATLVPLGVVAYLVAAERGIATATRSIQASVRPWLWLLPSFVLVGGILVYPLLKTIYLSFRGPESGRFVGSDNYKAIFNDPELMPLKGQLTVLIPQPEITYRTSGGVRPPAPEASLGIHMMPRSDGIVLGGMSLRDVWTTDVEENERTRIVEGHIELFNAMRKLEAGVRT